MLKPDAALRKDQISSLGKLEHRHFATIAAIIKQIGDTGMRAQMSLHFADACARTNPKFDRARFLRACNVEG